MINSNKTFAATDSIFKQCCIDARCKITKRQASKFRRGKGIAYKVRMAKATPLRLGHPGYQVYMEA